MDSFIKLARQIQKQSKELNSSFGPIKDYSKIISYQAENYRNTNLSSLSAITSLAKNYNQYNEPRTMVNALLKNDFSSTFVTPTFPKNNFVLSGLTETISKIAQTNLSLSETITNFASSQLILSSNLGKIASMFNESHLQEFNGLQIALQGISKNYLRDIQINRNWEDIKIAEEVNEVISNETQRVVDSITVTVDDLNKLQFTIIEQLTSLFSKTKGERAKLFIFDLINIIGFILTLYTTHQQEIGKTNQEIINELKSEIRKSNHDLSNRIEFELAKLNKIRTAKTNVKLRFSTKKNSKIIGLIKLGQQVTVIEIQHKYLLISYLDKETGEPKSGFVIKKYFTEK